MSRKSLSFFNFKDAGSISKANFHVNLNESFFNSRKLQMKKMKSSLSRMQSPNSTTCNQSIQDGIMIQNVNNIKDGIRHYEKKIDSLLNVKIEPFILKKHQKKEKVSHKKKGFVYYTFVPTLVNKNEQVKKKEIIAEHNITSNTGIINEAYKNEIKLREKINSKIESTKKENNEWHKLISQNQKKKDYKSLIKKNTRWKQFLNGDWKKNSSEYSPPLVSSLIETRYPPLLGIPKIYEITHKCAFPNLVQDKEVMYSIYDDNIITLKKYLVRSLINRSEI